jgi:hypothetical protein
MANVGAEIGSTMRWKNKGNAQMSKNAFFRGLELLDYTIQDKKNVNSLKEIVRVREALLDYFLGDNIYKSSDLLWEKYFHFFNVVTRKDH